MRNLNIICLLFLALLSSCKEASQIDSSLKNDTEISKEKEDIKTTLIKMWEAIENEDIQAYASYVHPDFSQFGEYDSIIKLGKEIEVKGVKNWIETSANIHTEMEEPIVTIKGDVAWITYYWKDHGTTNGEPFASRGKSTRIFVKENDEWLCIHGHYTLLPSPN